MRTKLKERLREITGRPTISAVSTRGNLDHYAAEFGETAKAFRAFAHQWRPPAATNQGQITGVVVTPWVSTPVPWYSLALAMGLAQRGRRVQIIWDDSCFPEVVDQLEAQNYAIHEVLEALNSQLPYAPLSAFQGELGRPEDWRRLQELAEHNTTWTLRAAVRPTPDRALFESYLANLSRALPRVRGLLRQQRFAYLLVPGGIRGTSGLYRWVGEEAGTRVATYDANLGVVQVATEGVAAQQSDLPRAFQIFLSSQVEESERQNAIAEAQRHLDLRIEGRDRARYQSVPPMADGQAADIDVLIPLNVEHDAAALGRHRLFEDTVEWVTATTAHILEQPEGTIAIRQHPAERHPHERGQFGLERILDERFGQNPRLTFIPAAAPINTYDLVARARLILPFVSTIGIEAVALGKPTVVAGNSCYSDLGFVWRPDTRQEYLELVSRGLRGELAVSSEQRERAWLCYYLTPVCNRIWTRFTPQPPDFWTWCSQKPTDVFADEAVQDILTAVDEDVPAAIIRHQRHMRGQIAL